MYRRNGQRWAKKRKRIDHTHGNQGQKGRKNEWIIRAQITKDIEARNIGGNIDNMESGGIDKAEGMKDEDRGEGNEVDA